MIFSIELSKNFNVSILFTINTCHFLVFFSLTKTSRSVTLHTTAPRNEKHAKENIGFMDFLGFELASLSSQYLGCAAM